MDSGLRQEAHPGMTMVGLQRKKPRDCAAFALDRDGMD
jgi:hypothetical protein